MVAVNAVELVVKGVGPLKQKGVQGTALRAGGMLGAGKIRHRRNLPIAWMRLLPAGKNVRKAQSVYRVRQPASQEMRRDGVDQERDADKVVGGVE